MTRRIHECDFEIGGDDIVWVGAVADVLAGDAEAVAVASHVAEHVFVGGRDLVAEVTLVAHVLGPPPGLLGEVRVVDEGVEPGVGAVLVGKREQELFIAGAESRGAPGEGRSSRGHNCRDGKKQGQGGNPQPERRTARRGRRRCWL